MLLTPRDLDILIALTQRIRFFSSRQIAETWYGTTDSARRNAHRRLLELKNHGYLCAFKLSAKPELALTGPLATWSPGDKKPNFQKISYEAKKRWHHPPVPLLCYLADHRAIRLLGGKRKGVPHLPLQATHDLHVSRIYLLKPPKLRDLWLGEDNILSFGPGKRPDAVLVKDGKVISVLDFVGAYPPHAIEKIHHHCEVSALPYELW